MIRRILEKIKRTTDPISFWRSKGMKIGADCSIYPTASFSSEPYLITLGDHVRVNEGVTFVTHDGGIWVLRGTKDELKNADCFRGATRVGNNVHIGTNATIMPGIRIGSNCIIGCNAVVTKDVPDNSVVVGVPAKVIESIEKYENKNKKYFTMTKLMSAPEKERFLLDRFCLK